MNVYFSPETENYLFNLTRLLYQKHYFGYYKTAELYIHELAHEIKNYIHLKQAQPASSYFKKYGRNLYYVSISRNKRTTWYVFFTYHPNDTYYIRYITNNHVAGHLL